MPRDYPPVLPSGLEILGCGAVATPDSLGIPGFPPPGPGHVTLDGFTRTFREDQPCPWPVLGGPPPQGGGVSCGALLKQFATDWYNYRLLRFDRVYNGILSYEPEGYTDSIEWTYVEGDCTTRAMASLDTPADGVEWLNHDRGVDCCAPPPPGILGGFVDFPYLVTDMRMDDKGQLLITSSLFNVDPFDDERFKVACVQPPAMIDTCCKCGYICVSVSDRCGNPVFGATITITAQDPPPPGSPEFDEFTCTIGQVPGSAPPQPTPCCVGITYAGHYQVQIDAPGFISQTHTITAVCDQTSPNGASNGLDATMEPADDPDEPYPVDLWVASRCCPCTPTGRRPDRIPRKLYVTLNGPAEFLGGLAGIPLELDFDPTTDDGWTGLGPPPGGSQRWFACTSSGAQYGCYTLDGCLLPFGAGGCSTPFSAQVATLQSLLTYGSTLVELVTGYAVPCALGGNNGHPCYTTIKVTHFYGPNCDPNSGGSQCPPSTDPGNPFAPKIYTNGYPFCKIQCPCNTGVGQVTEGWAGFYPRSWSAPIGATVANSFCGPGDPDYIICGPVNYTASAPLGVSGLGNTLTSCTGYGRPGISATVTE